MEPHTTEDHKTEPQGTPSEQKPETASHDDAGQKKMLIGILSYLSVLVAAAYLMGKEDTSTHFHIKQGIVLFVAEIAAMVIIIMIPILFPLYALVQIALVILAIIGIVNVVKGREKELPFIGQFAKHVSL